MRIRSKALAVLLALGVFIGPRVGMLLGIGAITLLTPSLANATVAIIGTCALGSDDTDDASFTVTGVNITAGALVNVCVKWEDDSAAVISTVSDGTNNYDETSITASPDNGATTQMAFMANAAAVSSATITITLSTAAPFKRAVVCQYSDVATSSPLDQQNSGSSNGTNVTISSVITTQNEELLVICTGLYSSKNPAAGANWTERTTGTSITLHYADRVVASINSYGISGTGADSISWSVTESYSAGLATFKEDVSGGGGGPTLHNLPLTGVGK